MTDFMNILWGITRSGRRWFWTAVPLDNEERELYGWTDTEPEALAACKAAVSQLAEDADEVSVSRRYLLPRNVLKKVNRAKRASRPAPAARPAPGPQGSAIVEYLYACPHEPRRYQITKRTAQRIYFLSWYEVLNLDGSFNYDPRQGSRLDPDVYFVDRKRVETDTGVWHRGISENLYITFEAAVSWKVEKERERAAKMKQDEAAMLALKEAMDAAHPDNGGTLEAFILARTKYELALDKARVVHRACGDM